MAVVALMAPAASAQGFKWWQSEMFKRELGLTADQSAKIEAIFQTWLGSLGRPSILLSALYYLQSIPE